MNYEVMDQSEIWLVAAGNPAVVVRSLTGPRLPRVYSRPEVLAGASRLPRSILAIQLQEDGRIRDCERQFETENAKEFGGLVEPRNDLLPRKFARFLVGQQVSLWFAERGHSGRILFRQQHLFGIQINNIEKISEGLAAPKT